MKCDYHIAHGVARTRRRMQNGNCGLPRGLRESICHAEDGGLLQTQDMFEIRMGIFLA